jgi:hypothetical protein
LDESKKNLTKINEIVKEAEDKLFDFTFRNLFGGRQSKSLEEAMERALGFKEDKEEEPDDGDSWL